MTKTFDSRAELNCYCQYLLGKEADEQSIMLFEKASQQSASILSTATEKIIAFMIQHPSSVSFIDAAIGLFYPKHPLRKRMITAFAILETNPLYFSFFKPKEFSSLYLITLTGSAIAQGIKALTGRIILFFV